MARLRVERSANYAAVFTDSFDTVHWKLDPNKPYSELASPELYDIAINNKCFGRCPYCYISSVPEGVNYRNVVEKAHSYFGSSMSPDERPFQVAIGGAGEPTLHPEFPAFLAALCDLGIVPNYTTNGMHLSPAVLDATEAYTGGVAVTAHKHLDKHWRRAIEKLHGITRLNLHFIPMSKDDVEWMMNVAHEYAEKIDYFVVLPYQAIGFGEPLDMQAVYEFMFRLLKVTKDRMPELFKQFAFGAMFYDELKKRPWVGADLYEHGLFSKYLDMGGDMSLYRSSYEWNSPIQTGLI